MEPTDAELQKVKARLTEYANKIKNGGELHFKNDALELDVDGGRIWLHPGDDGTTVNIHIFDDTENRDFSPAAPDSTHTSPTNSTPQSTETANPTPHLSATPECTSEPTSNTSKTNNPRRIRTHSE